MTYGENKKRLYALIDEWEPNSNYFTDDEDAREKCANLYSLAYEEVAGYRTPRTTITYNVNKADGNVGYERFSLPDANLIHSITALDDFNNRIAVDYYILGQDIYISNSKEMRVVIEYEPYLTPINNDTLDDFELELDQDLQMILPYKVASDLFKTDPGENYQAFEKEFQRRLQNIRSSKFGINVNISEGDY